MTLVVLLRLARKESNLRRIFRTFLVFHNHRTVRLYGYSAIISDPKIRISRPPIRTFDITGLDGKGKWTTYSFIVRAYMYFLTLIKTVYSVIDELPQNSKLEQS